jgi:serine/threonine-protein kinase
MPGEQSILLRLEAEGRAAPRVQLREAEEAPSVESVQLRASGRFEVLGELAQGGVGQILKGRDTDLGSDVAIKVLRERHAESPEIIQRLPTDVPSSR